MRRTAAIVFLFTYLSVNTELHQVFRLPVFFVHYLEHKKGNQDITLLNFIAIHYFNGNVNHDDHDQELPFKSNHCTEIAIPFVVPADGFSEPIVKSFPMMKTIVPSSQQLNPSSFQFSMKTLRIVSSILVFLVVTFFGLKIARSFLVTDQLTYIKTAHFNVSYQGIFREEANNLAKYLEDQYDKIRTDLNDPDHDTIRVFIHSTQNDFNAATGLLNSNANGTSRGPLAFHILWTNWYNSIFPDDPEKTAVHEFTHCVQLNILIHLALKENSTENKDAFNAAFEKRFAHDYPQWFWEALSVYEANEINTVSVQYTMRQKPTLDYLNNSNQIYNVGYTLVEYIVETWGKDKLPELITSYVDLNKVLNITEAEFEKGWIEFVDKKY